MRRDLSLGVVAAAIGAALLWLGPPGSDLAAHEYLRWFFLEHGFALWDNYWYSGRYTFATYSWLTYPLAAAVGVKPLFAAALGLAAAAFSALTAREWGDDARWAAYAFAGVWGAFALSGALPFALGVAFALLALSARSRALFAGLAVLTWAASPLALLLLSVVLAGAALARRRLPRFPAAVLAGLIVLQVVLSEVYDNPGRFPFRWEEVAAAAAFCVVGVLLTLRHDRTLACVFGVYLLLIAAAAATDSTLGENAARLRFLALPLSLLILGIRGFRPKWLAVSVTAVAAVYNLSPLAWSFEKGLDERAEHAAYWAPALAFLRRHADPNFRVHSLDTVQHWEAYHLPRNGIPITRGWFRQDDFPHNELLYRRGTGARRYGAWLRAHGVRYVLVPDSRLDYSSKREPELVRAVARYVLRAGEVEIWELENARPIVPGGRVTRYAHDSLTVRVPRPATVAYRVAIRRGEDWVKLPAARAGSHTLRFP